MAVNYYQLVTLVEADQKVLNFSGWVVNIITFIFTAITFGYPSLVCLKKLVVYIKRTHFNVENMRQNYFSHDQRNLQQAIIWQKNMTRERLSKFQLRNQNEQTIFIDGMRNRGLTPISNLGGGNCVFMSLAHVVFGDAARFKFMRYMIVHRLRRFPKQYQGDISNFPMYCNSMAVNGKAASTLELQAVADICFSVVECYTTSDFLVPTHTMFPFRLSSVSESTSRIRLWIKDAHCMALVNNGP